MISRIFIDNFATIEHLDLDFDNGLNIITGETGAGKSILIEAISLGLGARADSSLIRTGAEKACVQLICEYEDNEYIISREINANGKNVCKINDKVVTLASLSEFASNLADIHGQYDNQSLLNPDNHIILLDAFNPEIGELKTSLRYLHDEYMQIKHEYDTEIAHQNEYTAQQDFWNFALTEINSANLKENEDVEIQEQISILKNSEKIYSSLSSAYSALNGNSVENSALTAIGNSLNALATISEYHKGLAHAHDAISASYYSLEDAVEELREILEQISFSENDLDQAMQRLHLIENLKSKYGGSITSVTAYAEELKGKIDAAEDFESNTENLRCQLRRKKEELITIAENLSSLRKATAEKLSAEIMNEMHELNFNDAKFDIVFNKKKSINENGIDEVEFFMSANKGEESRPLSKTASGGEMSRIMLAFKKVLASYDAIPTMIFDEIDSGISGNTAVIIGRKMAEISNTNQIICITHLPQIAAYGKQNYKIEKSSDLLRTYTSVKALSDNEKIQEIARLIGGMKLTETALASARELIESSTKKLD